MPPRISIIMNCLNCAKDLPQALESVRNQTFSDWEVIFWDNGSKDGSAKLAKDFGPKLRYFYGENTVSLGSARNLAIAQASGEFIAFLDCDDFWLPQKLEKQVAVFDNNAKVGLVCTDTAIYDGKRVIGRMFTKGEPARGMAFKELMQRQWISMSSAMVRRDALAGIAQDAQEASKWFDERFELCEEADVFYRIAHDWELDYIPEALTIWRVHGKNTTFRKFDQFANETLLILAKHRQLYPGYDDEYKDLVEMLEKRANFQKAISLWRNGQNVEARKLITPHLGDSPRNRLFWAASFLPGSLFNIATKLYFALPQSLRK